jgi:hypothetical protein
MVHRLASGPPAGELGRWPISAQRRNEPHVDRAINVMWPFDPLSRECLRLIAS